MVAEDIPSKNVYIAFRYFLESNLETSLTQSYCVWHYMSQSYLLNSILVLSGQIMFFHIFCMFWQDFDAKMKKNEAKLTFLGSFPKASQKV